MLQGMLVLWEKASEMKFWTEAEYGKFIEVRINPYHSMLLRFYIGVLRTGNARFNKGKI